LRFHYLPSDEQRYAPDFARLNRRWLESFGLIEEADGRYLDFPRESIIDTGGQIFFAVEEGVVLGTCAAIHHSGEVLTKTDLSRRSSPERRGIVSP